MSNRSSKHKPSSLAQLRHYLIVYAAALTEWRQAIDDADRKIDSLTPDQAQLASDEIHEIRTSRLEYLALKNRIDEGWMLYRQLSADDDVAQQQERILN